MELVRTERERVASLNDKAAQLAGFSGVILVILGSLAKDGFKAHLGSVGELTFAVSYFAAAVGLVAAILVLILRAYQPRRFLAIDTDEIANYLGDERLLRAEPWALQIRTMRTLHPLAKIAETGAAEMAAWIKLGGYIFALGISLFLVAVLTLGIGQL